MTVHLTGVTDVQLIAVTPAGVTDSLAGEGAPAYAG